MDRIKIAIERAKLERDRIAASTHALHPDFDLEQVRGLKIEPLGHIPVQKVPVGRAHFEETRIYAFDATDPRSAHFDMLRTQVIQKMSEQGWTKVAISSPTPDCGKTVIAINLALSIARLSECSVLLVDLDLRKPRLANYLGLSFRWGIENVLAGECRPENALIVPDLGNQRLEVFANHAAIPNSTEVIASTAMKQMVKQLIAQDPKRILLFDLPPILSSDDFLAFIPQVDCLLLIAAVGHSTIDQVDECQRLLANSNLLGVVLNKASQSDTGYSSYY